MKKIIKVVLLVITVVSLALACRKIEVGFLSDYVKYGNTLITVPNGVGYTSAALVDDGSTLPLSIELLAMRNSSTGAIATDLITPRPLQTWKALYNYKTDTTAALVNAKIEMKDLPAFELNKVSGQFRFNPNTRFATGTDYEFDLRISNIRGTKDYPKIGKIKLAPFAPLTYVGGTNLGVTNQTTNVAIYSFVEDINLQIAGTSLVETITKISTESAPGITVILKVLDKNGTPWNPAAGEVLAGYPGSVLPNYLDSSVGTEFKSDRIIYHFPVTPFPFTGALWYNANPLAYFNVPNKCVGAVDSKGLVAGQVYNPAQPHYLRFRLNHFIYDSGTWEIKVNFLNVTRK